MVCHGQTVDSLMYHIQFAQDSTALDIGRADNSDALSCFANDLDSLRNAAGVSVLEVTVRGHASWDGSYIGNRNLSRLRARSVSRFIKNSFGVDATTTESCQFESEIIDFVAKSGSEYSDKILSVLNSSDSTHRKIQTMKRLDSRQCWRWLKSKVFPEFRRTDIIIRYSVREKLTIPPVVRENIKMPPVVSQPSLHTEAPMKTEEPVQTEEPVKTEEPVQTEEPAAPMESPFYLALKNNLIYDAALVANMGLEISLSRHFALDLPFTFRPYTISNNYRMRTLSIQPELRYYFKQGGKGHFFGIHGNLAYYNVVTPYNTRTRFQDRDGKHPLYGGGISYGYSLPLRKNSRWGVEFTIGVGYAYLDYDCFYNVHNGAWFTKDTKHYFGIEKAGITIYYRIMNKSRKKK